jgi:UDP-MurNAc hydroxylase
MRAMRVTFLGHAGLFVETRGGSVLCDPWFTPAYFGSWFPFPRNDRLDRDAIASPDFLYVSHLHRDHFDPEFLAAHVDTRARVLLPEFRVPLLEDALRDVGFEHFVRTRHAEPTKLGDLEVTVFAMTAPSDGPLGDSAIAIADDTARVLNQNDARPGDPAEIEALGPFDAHFLQFSGASWFPVVYDFPETERTRLASEKRVNGLARARRYVDMMGARHVFPSAGPPCFLDDDLWELNDVDRDERNIFPDQSVFLDQLAAASVRAHLVLPGSVVELADGDARVTHPADVDPDEPFRDKRAYLERYRADWKPWLDAERESWSHAHHDVVRELREWFEPLLADAPLTRSGVGGNVVLHLDDVAVAIDFVRGTVREWNGEELVYRLDVDRALVEACIERRLDDWVNSLLLSCRFRAHRRGPFNEYVHTFFKSLSPERMAYVEACYRDRLRRDETFVRDGWRLQRRCPHRQADLTRFGTIDDGMLRCSVHDWQWDLATGRCMTSEGTELHCEWVGEPGS